MRYVDGWRDSGGYDGVRKFCSASRWLVEVSTRIMLSPAFLASLVAGVWHLTRRARLLSRTLMGMPDAEVIAVLSSVLLM